MFFQFVNQATVLGGKNPDDFRGAAQSDQGLIGTDICGLHRVVLIAGFDDTAAGSDIPNDDAARLAAAPATSQKQGSVATEFQNINLSFRERKSR